MAQCSRVLTTAFILFAILAADARGQRLLAVDGIELHGAAQLVMSGGGTCNVLESDTSYEARKGNHGAPMDIWRLDFSVLNTSGRWLDHLIARYQIESKWPECTHWDGPEAGVFSQNIEWADSAGHIQKSGRNVVAPGRTLNATHLFIVLRDDPQPRFENWSVDFDFAAAPPSAGFRSAAEAQQNAPVPTPEQENIFWQSIVDSTDPADFESYLQQFPNGVFRSLAQNRLRAFEKTTHAGPAGTAPAAEPTHAPEPTCKGHDSGVHCWQELASHSGCYVWDDRYVAGKPVSWSGACVAGRASGTGTIRGTVRWFEDPPEYESRGAYVEGKKEGQWTERTANNLVEEGPYVDGRRHGHWVERFEAGDFSQGPYLNGKRHGEWVWQDDDGTRVTSHWVNGEEH